MTTFWTSIMCALGSCAGTLAAHLIMRHNRDKEVSIVLGRAIKEIEDTHKPNYFTEKFGEDGKEWDKLKERTTKVREMIPEDKFWEFTNEIVAPESLEGKWKVIDKWEAKYNNSKEEQEK